MGPKQFHDLVLGFPETEFTTSYGQPAYKSFGKFLTRLRDEDDSVVLGRVPIRQAIGTSLLNGLFLRPATNAMRHNPASIIAYVSGSGTAVTNPGTSVSTIRPLRSWTPRASPSGNNELNALICPEDMNSGCDNITQLTPSSKSGVVSEPE